LLDRRHDEGSCGVCDGIKVGIEQKLCAGMKWNGKEESWIRKNLRLAFRNQDDERRAKRVDNLYWKMETYLLPN
jgi:hypothetical protein